MAMCKEAFGLIEYRR